MSFGYLPKIKNLNSILAKIGALEQCRAETLVELELRCSSFCY